MFVTSVNKSKVYKKLKRFTINHNTMMDESVDFIKNCDERNVGRTMDSGCPFGRPGNNSSPTGRLRFWPKTYCQLPFVDLSKLMQYITYISNIYCIFILIANKNDDIQISSALGNHTKLRCQRSLAWPHIVTVYYVSKYIALLL